MCQRRLSVALVTDAHTQKINNNEVQKKNEESSGQRSIKSEQVLGTLFIVKQTTFKMTKSRSQRRRELLNEAIQVGAHDRTDDQ